MLYKVQTLQKFWEEDNHFSMHHLLACYLCLCNNLTFCSVLILDRSSALLFCVVTYAILAFIQYGKVRFNLEQDQHVMGGPITTTTNRDLSLLSSTSLVSSGQLSKLLAECERSEKHLHFSRRRCLFTLASKVHLLVLW